MVSSSVSLLLSVGDHVLCMVMFSAFESLRFRGLVGMGAGA